MSTPEKLSIIKKIHAAWRSGDLRYKMHDGQLQIHAVLRSLPESVRIRLMECCRGYGKTTLNVLMACEDCAKAHPLNYPVRIIGPEKDQTVEIVAQIFDIIGREAPPGWIRRKGSTWYVGNNRIIVSGFNRGSIERLRGKRAFKIYLEEIRDVPSEDFEYGMKAVVLPMSLAVRCPVTAATTSSKELLHSMNVYYKPVADENNGYFNFNIYNCPLYGPAEIEQAVKDCGGIDTDDFKREYLCESVESTVQRAVPAFCPERHVRSFDLPEDANVWLVTDVGGLQDPTHSVAMFFDQKTAKVKFYKEQTHLPHTATSIMVKGWLELEDELGIDPDNDEKPTFLDCMGQFMVDLRDEHLYRCRFVMKGGFEESVKSLNQGFHDDLIEVHPDCAQLIHQLATGKLNKAHNNFERATGVTTFIAHHCDGIAAAMYGWRLRDISKTFRKFSYNSETQWVHPKVLAEINRGKDGTALSGIQPKMKRF